jgi:hypothetical protein
VFIHFLLFAKEDVKALFKSLTIHLVYAILVHFSSFKDSNDYGISVSVFVTFEPTYQYHETGYESHIKFQFLTIDAIKIAALWISEIEASLVYCLFCCSDIIYDLQFHYKVSFF